MLIETLSTFPDMYASVMGASIMKRAQECGALEFRAYDLRDWTHDRHRTTDDDPYGGGQGLVMKVEPIFEAYDAICNNAFPSNDPYSNSSPSSNNGNAGFSGEEPPFGDVANANPGSAAQPRVGFSQSENPQNKVNEHQRSARGENAQWAFSTSSESVSPKGGSSPEGPDAPVRPYTIFLAPTGKPFTQAVAAELAERDRLLFICGHYEGIDERAYALADEVISLGDYVLTSGELASMVVIDAVVRLLSGVLGDEGSSIDESFYDGLLEYPQYTRPASFRGMDVPEVLLSGNHALIDAWRREQSVRRTAELRPDLLATANLTEKERRLLESLYQAQSDDDEAVS